MIRPYTADDSKILENMLLMENIPAEEIEFVNKETWVYDDGEIRGFYSWKIDHKIFPHMIYFCVDRGVRDGRIARILIKNFMRQMSIKGYKSVFIHARNKTISKLVEWFFKTRPHTVTDEYVFYLVEVSNE